jgi:predicted O-methyltransferase YrrM
MLKKFQSLLTRTNVFYALLSLAFLAVGVAVLEMFVLRPEFPRLTVLVTIGGLFFSILLLYLRNEYVFQNLLDETYGSYHGIEALLYTNAFLKPRLPLPQTREWAASPDLLNLIIEKVVSHRPNTVVEIGAGASTVAIAYALEKNNKGKLYSVDNYKEYLEAVRNVIVKHDLERFVQPIFAPLNKSEIKGKRWTYYASEPLETIGEIDMLIVDGPPGSLQPHARYPAMPFFFEKLRVGAIVIVDDYGRKEDKETVQLWIEQYAGLKLVEESPTEKGTAVLVKLAR